MAARSRSARTAITSPWVRWTAARRCGSPGRPDPSPQASRTRAHPARGSARSGPAARPGLWLVAAAARTAGPRTGSGWRTRPPRDAAGCLAAADMAAHHGLGPVIDDGRRHATEVRKASPVAVPERGQVLRRHIAAERVTRIRQHDVEAEGVQRPARGLDLALVTPVDLRLGASQNLKAPVQVGRIGRDADHAFPVLAHIHLDPLIVAVEPVLGDQPLVDRDRLELRLLGKPAVDEVGVRVDLARAGPTPAGAGGLELASADR